MKQFIKSNILVIGFTTFFLLVFINVYSQQRIGPITYKKLTVASGIVTDKFKDGDKEYLTINSSNILVEESTFKSTNINDNVVLSLHERIYNKYYFIFCITTVALIVLVILFLIIGMS